jgi:hypothetical protein
MKLRIYIVYVLMVFLSTLSAREQDELDRKISSGIKSARSGEQDLSWITEELRPIVIDRLLEKLNDERWPFAEEKLIIIGHKETMQRLADKLRANPAASKVLAMEFNEELITYLMPLVYTGSKEVPPNDGDVIIGSVQQMAFNFVMANIQISTKFPEETREWATKLNRAEGEKSINLLKQWWEQNQTAILEKRYADATWLPRYKGKPVTYSMAEMRERKADEERERTSREASRTGGSDSKKAVDAPTPTSNWPLWATLIASFFALLGVSYYFKIRNRQV